MSRVELAQRGITPSSVTAMINHAACCWVACEHDEVIGFSMIDLKTGSLFAAFVLPSHEGLGIGRQLVQAAEVALFSHHHVVWLETARHSRAAGFYRHLGWSNEQDIGDGDIRLEKHSD